MMRVIGCATTRINERTNGGKVRMSLRNDAGVLVDSVTTGTEYLKSAEAIAPTVRVLVLSDHLMD